MNRILPAIAIACVIPMLSFAQNAAGGEKSKLSELHELRWLDISDRSISPEQVLQSIEQEYQAELRMEDAPISLRSTSEMAQRSIIKQYYQGLEVEFAQVYVHHRDGLAEKVNGVLVPDVQVMQTDPLLSEEEALGLALECVGAGSYYWEHEALEHAKKHALDDQDATFYPEGKLLLADQDFNHRSPDDFRLAWKFEIYSRQPEGRAWVYVDAMTGEIFKELDLTHTNGFSGTAETRYNGTRDIITDTAGGVFVLRDYTRGRGVETFGTHAGKGEEFAKLD